MNPNFDLFLQHHRVAGERSGKLGWKKRQGVCRASKRYGWGDVFFCFYIARREQQKENSFSLLFGRGLYYVDNYMIFHEYG